jgi:hypothetical protein
MDDGSEPILQIDLLQMGLTTVKDLRYSEWNYAAMPKRGMNELALPDHIALRQPPDLPLADQMHRLITVCRPQCPFWRPEPQTRRNALLDESMVLLNDVV